MLVKEILNNNKNVVINKSGDPLVAIKNNGIIQFKNEADKNYILNSEIKAIKTIKGVMEDITRVTI